MKKKIILRAPVLTISGYGVHSRQIFRWLETKKSEYDLFVETLMWGNTSWMINHDLMGGLVGRVMRHTMPAPPNADISIQVQLPNEWDPKIARYNIGVTAGVETDRCHPDWIKKINEMDVVVVPSEHTKKTFENSGSVQKRIVVIPEAFISEIENPNMSLMKLPEIKTDFNFLVMGQLTGHKDLTDRKNTYRTLQWICEVFKKDPDVGIVLKTNSARNSKIDRAKTKDILKQALGVVRQGDTPPVYFIHGELTNEEIAALYLHPKIKALVSLTRGEGYGLPILEAAASNLPVIATDWSGHLDFMNKGKFIKVDYVLSEINKAKVDGKLFLEGAKWAEPRESSAKKAFKKFREMPDIPKENAMELGKVLREEYSQESIEKKYDKLLSDIILW
jgi:glycosyltransferase involved in cell wall biosynthesis